MNHLKIGDLVMVDRNMVGHSTASCLPEVVWMKAGTVCEVNLFRARVQYGAAFFAWFDLLALYPSQGPELFRPEEVR